jgi:hypothetical protein
MKANLDLYTDYLVSSFGQTTATGLSTLMDGLFSHDQVTDLLKDSAFDNRALWQQVKPLVRKVGQAAGVLIVDDSIAHKPHSAINGLVCSHYDHSSGQQVKGINFVSLLYAAQGVRIPVGVSLVVKYWQSELKTKQALWRAMVSKNELFRQMLQQAYQNAIPFGYVLGDSWYTNADNINAVLALGKHYLGAVKSNLEVALSTSERAEGKFIKISELKLQPGTVQKVYLRSVKSAVVVCRDIFINKDGSEGELLLLSTDVKQTYQQNGPPALCRDPFITTYQKRWEVEDYHKSLKNNACLEMSPARTIPTQSMHLFASVCAFVKLERLKIKEAKNHFALKIHLYLKAIRAAFDELTALKQQLIYP